jgi:hypothetical protein
VTAQSDWPHASSRADEADNETAERDDLPELSPEDRATSPAMDADPDVIVVSAHEDLLDEDDMDDLDDEPADEPELDDDIIAATAVPSAGDAPTEDEPAADEPTMLEPTVLEPTVLEPTADEPTALEPAVDDDELAADEPTLPELAVDADEPAADEPAADEPAVPEPAFVASQTGPASDGYGAAGLSPHWHDIQAQFVDDPRGSVELAAAAVDEAVTELVEALNRRRAGLVPAAGVPEDPESTEQLREALRSCRMFCQNLADISERFSGPESLAS